MTADRSVALRVRFAPPKSAIRVGSVDAQNGDWGRWAGYWWHLTRLRRGYYGGVLVDLESPRGQHTSVWTHQLVEIRRG